MVARDKRGGLALMADEDVIVQADLPEAAERRVAILPAALPPPGWTWLKLPAKAARGVGAGHPGFTGCRSALSPLPLAGEGEKHA